MDVIGWITVIYIVAWVGTYTPTFKSEPPQDTKQTQQEKQNGK